MSWFERLFQKKAKEPEKPKTRAFVDYGTLVLFAQK